MLIGAAFCQEMARQKMTMLAASSSFSQQMARSYSASAEEKRCMKDHNRRLMAAKFEVKRKLYKALVRDPELPNELKEKHRYKLAKLPRNSAFARIRNRCILTGRPRAVYQLFRMSRICFRELASRGSLMGIKKASWYNKFIIFGSLASYAPHLFLIHRCFIWLGLDAELGGEGSWISISASDTTSYTNVLETSRLLNPFHSFVDGS